MKSGIVTTALVATLVVASFTAGAGADPKTVAGLFYAKVTEGNWDPAGYKAFTAMVKKEGFKSSYAEEATYDKAPEILSDFAARGTDLDHRAQQWLRFGGSRYCAEVSEDNLFGRVSSRQHKWP